jgi:hypothetical protein
MTDPDLVAKKLAFIETCIADLLAFVTAIRARMTPSVDD